MLLEKTFPKLSSFTIGTWLQVLNYNLSHLIHHSTSAIRPLFLHLNDTRTIFTYSFDNFVNLLRCQISSTFKHKGGGNQPQDATGGVGSISSSNNNNKKVNSNLYISINVFNYECSFRVTHSYMNNSFWLHLAITWSSSSKRD